MKNKIEVWVLQDPYDRTIEESFWSEEEADEYIKEVQKQNPHINFYKTNVTPNE